MIIQLIALKFILSSTPLNIPEYPIQFPSHPAPQKKLKLNPNTTHTLSDNYLDQVIERKKLKIRNCTEKLNIQPYNFTAEITIAPSGKTTARLIKSAMDDISSKSEKHQLAQRCFISTLNRIRFKSFNNTAIIKKYFFQFEEK